MAQKLRRTLLRFADLKAKRYVDNWPQLRRLQDNHGFPLGFLLGPRTRVFDADEVEAWIAARREKRDAA